VFTENRNNEDGTEDSYLNIQECLTGEVIESTSLITNSSNQFKEME